MEERIGKNPGDRKDKLLDYTAPLLTVVKFKVEEGFGGSNPGGDGGGGNSGSDDLYDDGSDDLYDDQGGDGGYNDRGQPENGN